MYKIAAFLNFNKSVDKIIKSQKNKVKNNFGSQIYLNHPVHLTLFTLKIRKISELREIYNKPKVKK